MSIVRLRSADKYYNRGGQNQIHVMNSISLDLPESGMIAIFGKSGCGKTTLLNAIGGLDRISSGRIEVFGQNIKDNADEIRNRYIGYIFQNYNLNVKQTVYENVANALLLCGMTDEEEIGRRVMASLSNVGMENYRDRTPDTLSGGQQQRVAIARALVKGPSLILADEPTGNLDEDNTVLVMDILKEVSRERLVLLVTHEAELVDLYCDRVIEIIDGSIASDRKNDASSAFSRRNKNDIYLGELDRRSTEMPGLSLEYFGEPMGALRLKLINHGGKLYITADGEELRVIDASSELRLHDGTFREEKERAKERGSHSGGRHIDMSELSPFEGTHFGRLYRFGGSLISSLSEFFSKKKRRGKGLMRAVLMLLAMALVFTTAVNAVGIRSFSDLREKVNPYVFYIPLNPDLGYDYNRPSASIGIYGIDHAALGHYIYSEQGYFSFRYGSFMTATVPPISGEANIYPTTLSSGLALKVGTNKVGDGEMLISSAFADELLSSTRIDFLNSYENLLSLSAVDTDGFDGFTIVGIVESDESAVYVSPMAFADHHAMSFGVSVTPASRTNGLGASLAPGELAYVPFPGDDVSYAPKEGEKLLLFGREYTVTSSGMLDSQGFFDGYKKYVLATYGEELMTLEEYLNNIDIGLGTNVEEVRFRLELSYVLSYYPKYIQEYAKSLLPSYPYSESLWMMADHNSMPAYLMEGSFNFEPSFYYSAYMYIQETGIVPDKDEVYALDKSMAYDIESAYIEDMNEHLWEYNEYFESIQNGKVTYGFIMNDSDYIAMVGHAGESDERLTYTDIQYEERYDYYTNYLMVHSSDPEATEAFLRDCYGDGIMTPEDVFMSDFADISAVSIASAITIGVMLLVMCLFVYFIMRSSFMSRVKEVGILRAIGVSKKNIIYRFAVEASVLATLTVVIGFAVASALMVYLSDAPLFSEVFFYPPWLALALIVVLFAASVFFGILPALMLLRRTPSEILAKYDI